MDHISSFRYPLLCFFQDALLDMLRRSRVHFVHCMLPKAEALKALSGSLFKGGECEIQGEPGEMQVDAALLRAQLRGSKLLDALRIYRQGESAAHCPLRLDAGPVPKAPISTLGTQHRLPRPHGVLRVPSPLRRAGAAPHEEAREELHCEGREEGKPVSKTGKKCAALPVPAAKINAVRRQLHYIWP